MRPFIVDGEKKNEIVGSGGGGTSVMYLRALWRFVGLGCDECFRLQVGFMFSDQDSVSEAECACSSYDVIVCVLVCWEEGTGI